MDIVNRMDFLDIVDENDQVIGRASRSQIHQDGLLHREAHVWFVTPQGEVIFQHRSKEAETFPNLLDSTVGGHVEMGETYEATALKEVLEETGLELRSNQLVPIIKQRGNSFDAATGKTNNVFRTHFAFRFSGNVSELRVEIGKSLGFEAWLFEKLSRLSDEEKRKFIPAILSPELLEIQAQALRLV